MTKDDFKRFAVIWSTTHGVYGSEPTAEVLSVCFRTLEHYSLTEVEQALGAHLRDPEHGRFSPKPADIVRQIECVPEGVAAVAWTEVRRAIRTGNKLTDPTLAKIATRLGGLELLGDKTSRELDFMFPMFKSLLAWEKTSGRQSIAGNATLDRLSAKP